MSSAHATSETPVIDKPEVKAFIHKMATKHHFNEKQLRGWFRQAQFQPSIIAAMTKPAEKKAWHQYEAIFITPKRIQDGVAFWKTHAKTLAKAEKHYGVPAEIITAIIGVETFYGKQTGNYSVLDSLVTLGFYYPPRSKFFLSELEEFLLLAREEHWDPTQIKGSYAGAMGNPQFISSSYRRHAVDFNKNGERDLIGSIDDSIGSVANYFKASGWRPGEMVILPARVSGDKYHSLIASKQNPKPSDPFSSMSKLGVRLGSNAKVDPRNIAQKHFALVALEGKDGHQYWLGAQNFYVITRYNHSDHYAMAVYTLSQKIKEIYKEA
jgi:membrane-bound lytic murein transglycosylase B